MTPGIILSRLRRQLLAGSLFVLAAPALADCPIGAGDSVPADPDALLALATRLGEREAACLDDAGYLAWYGAVLNALGEIDAATVRLERALMLAPDMVAARVEYAVALGRSAHWAEAADLADQLLAEPGLPQGLRDNLKSLRSYWALQLPGFWGSVQLLVGYSSNLNGAPLQNAHSLTLDDQRLQLTLSPADSRRASTVTLAELAGGYESRLASGDRLYATSVLRARHSGMYADTDYQQFDTAFNWVGAASAARFNRMIGFGAQSLQSELALTTVRAGTTYEYATARCVLQSGVDVEFRHYPQRRTLDGVAPGLTLASRCELDDRTTLQPGLQLRAERDMARRDRPGADQQRIELTASLRRDVLGGWLESSASYQWQSDRDGYSPLLENNSIRHTRKTLAKLEYRYPFQAGWLATAGYNWARQTSNLSLFATGEQSIWLGLRRQW